MFVAAAAVLLAMLWVVWVVRFRPWVAHNDFAVMRVSLERALDGHIPTVGTYSRLGVYHPGPLREWVFVLPYALGGGRAATLPATALVLNAGWLLACGWLASRCRRSGCGVALWGGATLLVIGLGPNLASPWNPHLAILPLYVACWSVTLLWRGGDRNLSMAMIAVAAASFAGQLHASALPVAGSMLVCVMLIPVARAWPRVDWRACLPLVFGLLLWSGVLIDLRKLGSSNLVDLVQTGAASTLGIGNALGLLSRLLWPATGATGLSIRPSDSSLVGFSRIWVAAALAGLGATGLLAFQRRNTLKQSAQALAIPRGEVPDGDAHDGDARERDALVEVETVWRAAVLALALLMMAAITIAAFAPPPFRYLFGPLQAVAVFALTVLVVWPLGAMLRGVSQRSSAVASAVLCSVLAGVCVWMFAFVPVDDHESAARRALGIDKAVIEFLDDHPKWQTIEVLGLDMVGASAQDEVSVVAYRAGREVHSDQFGLHLPTPDGSEPALVVAMGPALDCLMADGTAQLVLSGSIGESPIGIFGLEADPPRRSRCLGA